MKKLLFLFFALPMLAWAQAPPIDCSVYGFCSGLGVPTIACRPGQLYTQIDGAGGLYVCTGFPPAWHLSSGGGGGGTPGGSTTNVQVNTASAFSGYNDFTYTPSTGTGGTIGVANENINGLVKFLGALQNTPRAQFDPLNPKYAGGLSSTQTPAQQYATMVAVAQDAYCSAPGGSEITYPSSIPLTPSARVPIYFNQYVHGSISSEYGSTPASLASGTVGSMGIFFTAGSTSLTCNGSTVTPTGANSVISGFLFLGQSAAGGPNDQGVQVNDQHVLVTHNSFFSFGGAAIYVNTLDSWVLHNYVQNADMYYQNSSNAAASPVGAVELFGSDSHFVQNEVTDGAGLLNSHNLVGVNPLNMACLVTGGGNLEVSDNLLQLCNVGIIAQGSSAGGSYQNNRTDGMSGPGIINNAINSSFHGTRLLYDCLDPSSSTCSLFVNQGSAQHNIVTGTEYGLSSGQFGTSNYVAEFEDDLSAAGNVYSANMKILGRTYTGIGLLPQLVLTSSSTGDVDAVVAVSTGSVAPNINDYSGVQFGDTTPINVTSFNGGVNGQRITVLGGNPNVTIINTQNGNFGFLPIHTCDGQPINLGGISGDLVFDVNGTAGNITQECSTYFANAHLNEAQFGISNPDVLDVTGSASTRQVPTAAIYAGPADGMIGAGTCYALSMTLGTGTVTQSSPLCSPETPATGANPIQVAINLPAQYSSATLYRYSSTVGGVTPGILASWGAQAAPASYHDTGAAPSSSTLPTLGQNTTGYLTINGALFSDASTTPTTAPAGGIGLNINASGLTYWNGSAYTVVTGTGGGITGLTAGYLPAATSSTTIGNSHLDDGVTTAATVTSTETIAAPKVIGTGTANGTFDMTYSGTAAAAPATNSFGISATIPITTPWRLSPAAAPATGLLYGTASGAVLQQSFLSLPTCSGTVLTFNGTSFSCVAGVTGILPFANGGLGTNSNFAAHQFFGNDTGSSAAPGALLIGTSDISPNQYASGAGTAQAQTVTLSPAATALTSGLVVRWKPTAANTGAAPTLAVNGLTATAITKLGTTALVAGDLATTAVATAIYDGTQFELQNPQTAAGGGSYSSLTQGANGFLGVNNTTPLYQLDISGSFEQAVTGPTAAITTTATLTSTATTIPISSSTGLPAGGGLFIIGAGTGTGEFVLCTAAASNQLTGCTRGVYNSGTGSAQAGTGVPVQWVDFTSAENVSITGMVVPSLFHVFGNGTYHVQPAYASGLTIACNLLSNSFNLGGSGFDYWIGGNTYFTNIQFGNGGVAIRPQNNNTGIYVGDGSTQAAGQALWQVGWNNSTLATGSATTSVPFSLVTWGTVASIANYSTSGTGFGVNAPTGFAGNLADFHTGTTDQFKVSAAGQVSANSYASLANCSSSASPAVCAAAADGSVNVAAAATTEVVNTTAVTANSQILLQFDSSLGTKLGVTCNTTFTSAWVSARTAGASFTITVSAAPTTNPACFSYSIVN